MCIFIYTLAQGCGHQQFQNVSECPVARGVPLPHTPSDGQDARLSETKFLFDTADSTTHTPEFYKRIFACPKRTAVRPVPGAVCDSCDQKARVVSKVAQGEAASLLATVNEEGEEGKVKVEVEVKGNENEKESVVKGGDGCLGVPKARVWKGRGRSSSSGSSAALVGAGVAPSASSASVGSSLNTTSDASTPRSFWKVARPKDIV